MILDVAEENRIMRLVILSFWWLFWLFNVVDKVIAKTGFLWVGKDRGAQFSEYFESIGITNSMVPDGFLFFVSLAELIALVFMTLALYNYFRKKSDLERAYTYYGILTSLLIFTFFAVGDQIFGDRVELLEHSIYWFGLILSWYIYTLFWIARKNRQKR